VQHRTRLAGLDQLVVTALPLALNATTTLGERNHSLRMRM